MSVQTEISPMPPPPGPSSPDTPPPPTPLSSSPLTTRRRRSSILKKTNDDSDSNGEGDSTAPRKCSHGRRISFTSVDIQEHDLTLGDHPDCSYGPPTALDWTVKRRHSIDVDDYEVDRCRETGANPRRTRRQMVINYYDRKDAIKDAGYTDKEIKVATKKKERTRARRKMTRSYANTPAGKVEEVLSSARRKFMRAVKIGPSKQTKENASPDDDASNAAESQRPVVAPVATTPPLPTKDPDEEDTSASNPNPSSTQVADSKKKQVAPASA